MDQHIRSILSRITLAPDRSAEVYRSGWLGEWLYWRIKPRSDGRIFRLKAVPAHCPDLEALDGREELLAFQRHCDALDDILRHVWTKDLRRIKVPFSLNGMIRVRLGDLLRFLVAHAERHLLQAQRIRVEPVI